MHLRSPLLWSLLLLAPACEGEIGPVGPQGLEGSAGPQGPAYVLTSAQLVGTWIGEKRIENPSGTGFTSDGNRTITFAADGTYTSDIFTDGTGSLSGSWIVLGTSAIVTSPPLGGGNALLFQLEDIVSSSDSLKFILDVRPVGNGFEVAKNTIYLLAKG